MGENPELLAMARRIASERLLKQRYTVLAHEVASGMRDRHDTVQIALAAIIETQERDAALAESYFVQDAFRFELGTAIATAIRSGKHYGKDHPHA